MDQNLLLLLIVAAAFGIVATIFILRRQRRMAAKTPVESRFAASTEGMKICPNCGQPNLWTDRNCLSCNARLPG